MATRCVGTGQWTDLSPRNLWPLPPSGPIAHALLDELRRRGFVEGQNLTIDYRAYAPHLDLTSQYASELVKAQVDVILTAGDIAIRAAQQATKTIPILAFTDDLVGSGLVELDGSARW